MANFHDGYLNRQFDFGRLKGTVQLVADNQSIVLDKGQGVLYLISDNTTATNRTFSISSAEEDGQKLVIMLNSAGATACEMLTAGNAKLTAAWQPATQYSTLTLTWLGGYWVETGRTVGA